jgi:serine/threonine-protein kinase HipA
MPKITVCPGTLAPGFTTYSPAFLRRMFHGRKVSHILPYEAPQKNEEDTERFLENRKRISISGVQEKFSLRLQKNKLQLTVAGEHGEYILKPIPRDLKKVDNVPANEQLTMQIARQVYGIHTAENGLIFFSSGEPAYITRRFDVKADGSKWGKEDFATLAGKTSDNAGPNFKYEYSYEEAGLLIQHYVPAWRIEVEKYFAMVVFNFLFSNGDAHLKNFALLESESGDYLLSPAYDLINTRLHVDDTDFALDRGLFKDDFGSDYYLRTHHRGKEDFLELAQRIGVKEERAKNILELYITKQPAVASLIERSFLNESSKRAYLLDYQTRRNRLESV